MALPTAFHTVGAEGEYSIFRAGAGILYKHKDPRLVFALRDGASIDIGNGTYTVLEISELSATLRTRAWAPYVLVGLGEHNAEGLDIFVDLGVAFLTGSELVLAAVADGALLDSRLFRENLGLEELGFRQDLGGFFSYWPILSIGIRYGFGGQHSDHRANR